MGKNNKIYKQTWGGNGATGGKNNYGKRMSNAWKWAGRGMGAMNAYSIWDDYSNKNTVTEKFVIEQLSNVLSTFGGEYGAAWSIGWEMGRQITNSDKYQEWKFNLYYDMWERRYGEPSSSNEWMWNYFYKNYKP